jgi:hypothetical protein
MPSKFFVATKVTCGTLGRTVNSARFDPSRHFLLWCRSGCVAILCHDAPLAGSISSADIFKTMENKSLFAKVINTVMNEQQKWLSKQQ